ncbi:beta-sarcoglycan-like isoform X2 [Salvelinus namaycush]|uniref:Beta-sarcoglycan n=1 Tax=Salvelinus namaycush TaxID=8040 RepID=A0A8U1BRZ4_SALNM|nr:beta-sarcoglycan-like isoform X2 [Salvelinus namaycush]
MASEQESSNGPVKRSMREKAIERRTTNKEHNSNFKAGYVPIEEERLHKTGLRGRKGNMAVCIIILLFLLALINLIVVFQQGSTKLSVEKEKTSITSDMGISFTDPRTQNTFFSTDFENHEFHLPKGVKVLNVKKASTERITSNASSDLSIKGDSKAIIRGNEGVFIMGKTVEFRMGGDIELRAENSIVLNGSVMVSVTRMPNSSVGANVYFDEGLLRYKLCMCADGTLFRVQVKYQNMGCQTSDNPCGKAH